MVEKVKPNSNDLVPAAPTFASVVCISASNSCGHLTTLDLFPEVKHSPFFLPAFLKKRKRILLVIVS